MQLQELAQFILAVCTKAGVNHKWATGFVLCEKTGSAAIGRHHALFNQLL